MTSRKKPQSKRSMVPWYVGGGILVLLVIAFITAGVGGDNNGDPSVEQYRNVSVSGGALPAYSQDTADAAIGLTMPEVTGESFDGTPVTITNDGRPKILLLLTHW